MLRPLHTPQLFFNFLIPATNSDAPGLPTLQPSAVSRASPPPPTRPHQPHPHQSTPLATGEKPSWGSLDVSMGTESTPCIVFTGVKKNLAYCCGWGRAVGTAERGGRNRRRSQPRNSHKHTGIETQTSAERAKPTEPAKKTRHTATHGSICTTNSMMVDNSGGNKR